MHKRNRDRRHIFFNVLLSELCRRMDVRDHKKHEAAFDAWWDKNREHLDSLVTVEVLNRYDASVLGEERIGIVREIADSFTKEGGSDPVFPKKPESDDNSAFGSMPMMAAA